MRKLELLAPAKNLECGIAAIDHGADAVYIGANHFGARMAAGNSVDDISTLCRYAHRFGATVHVTVNTIVYDKEMTDTLSLIRQLADIGVDALLVQDMGVLQLCEKVRKERNGLTFPSLHASTQCDSRTPEKVKWLHSIGFDRVVLARELSVDEIKNIYVDNPDVELEAFVHGALCVSYSGVCYASQYCFGRSANRGECAQFCRLKFDLLDSEGKEIEHQRHLLSLKDMCRIDNLKELADAGICAFKIEGRLKNTDYVKNVVAAYSKRLNEICRNNSQKYCRSSSGDVTYFFEPDLKKTFNRGFTTYFLHDRQHDIASPDTPKAMGEYVGEVKEIRGNSFNVAGTAVFANGDGLCFINDNHELEGFRVNKAVGNRLFPLRMPEHLRHGMGLYRNNDVTFEKLLAGKTAERRILATMRFGVTDDGFFLDMNNNHVEIVFEHQKAKKPQRENIIQQLTKLGNTLFYCNDVDIDEGADEYFIPSSMLSELRRKVTSDVEHNVFSASVDSSHEPSETDNENKEVTASCAKFGYWQSEYKDFPYLFNISNKESGSFYNLQGLKNVQNAFELSQGRDAKILMQCRHCIRYSLGYCVKRGGKKPEWKEPLYLCLPGGRRFRLEFKCSLMNKCQMNVYADE